MSKLWISLDLESQFYNNNNNVISDNNDFDFLKSTGNTVLKPADINLQVCITQIIRCFINLTFRWLLYARQID